MPSYLAVAGSCANVMPSIVLISRIPSAPSDAVPDSTTPIACPRSERASDRKKKSMGLYLTAILRTPAEVQVTVHQFHLFVGRHDVDAIGHDARAFGGFDHRQRRMAGEQRGKRAGMMRRQMLDENERNVRICRQRLEKLCKCLEASCRRAYADDGEVGGWFGCNWKGYGAPRGSFPSGTSRLLSHATVGGASTIRRRPAQASDRECRADNQVIIRRSVDIDRRVIPTPPTRFRQRCSELMLVAGTYDAMTLHSSLVTAK